MLLRDLRRLLDHHKEARTVGNFLTTIDTETENCDIYYTWPYGEASQLISKTFRSILHFACQDNDGQRGEEKIRMVLQAAKQSHVDLVQMIVTGEEEYKAQDGSWEMDSDRSRTPIHLLIRNNEATLESFRMMLSCIAET